MWFIPKCYDNESILLCKEKAAQWFCYFVHRLHDWLLFALFDGRGESSTHPFSGYLDERRVLVEALRFGNKNPPNR